MQSFPGHRSQNSFIKSRSSVPASNRAKTYVSWQNRQNWNKNQTLSHRKSSKPFSSRSKDKTLVKSQKYVNHRPHSTNSGNLNADRIKSKRVMINGELYENNYKPKHHFDSVRDVTILTGGIEEELVRYINTEANGMTVVGYVAWLRSKPILKALMDNAARVSLIVNKEDFSNARDGILQWYDSLPAFQEPLGVTFAHLPNTLIQALKPTLNHQTGRRHDVINTPYYHPVRCCGSPILPGSKGVKKNAGGGHAIMHSKCLIFFDKNNVPSAVATGSYNFSANAKNNIENMIFIRDPKVAMVYFGDFCNIYMMSSPLLR